MATPIPNPKTPAVAAPVPPVLANSKASITPPQVTQDAKGPPMGDMEVPSNAKLPLHEDIMQLARLGEIGPIQTLFEEGKYNSKYADEEGITPLHV